jgi:phosphoglycolate phosphatase-like HAD superfamily hydrolase
MPTRPIEIKAVLLHFESIRHQPGLEQITGYLRSKNVNIGLLCDQDKIALHAELKKNRSINPSHIDTILTGDDAPDPGDGNNAIVLAAQTWKIDPRQILLVSARQADMQMGRYAGAVTVFWNTCDDNRQALETCDYVAGTLAALKNTIRMGLPLPAGKLPNDLLQAFLNDFRFVSKIPHC